MRKVCARVGRNVFGHIVGDRREAESGVSRKKQKKKREWVEEWMEK